MLYFYVKLSGNPFDGFHEQKEVIKIYENKYAEDFIKISSSYDYKRSEFSFEISPKSNPEIIFTTTLAETTQIDRYAQTRALEYLYKIISDSLGTDFDHLKYRFNIFEEYDSPGILERDLTTRLSLNHYIADFSWDTPLLDPSEADVVFSKIARRIEDHLVTPMGELKIRAGVYDGKNYHYTEIDLN